MDLGAAPAAAEVFEATGVVEVQVADEDQIDIGGAQAQTRQVVREALIAGGMAPALFDEPSIKQEPDPLPDTLPLHRHVRVVVHHYNHA